jgi:hypothetical protein
VNPQHKVFIILAMVGSALAVAARDAGKTTSTDSLAAAKKPKTKYPKHLAALAGVLVVGTFALVAEELSAGAGLPFAFFLIFDTGLSLVGPGAGGSRSVIDNVSLNLLGGQPSSAPVAGVIPTEGAVFI